MRTRKLRP